MAADALIALLGFRPVIQADYGSVRDKIVGGRGTMPDLDRRFTFGTGMPTDDGATGYASKFWHVAATIESLGEDTYDLTALTDAGGSALSFSYVKMFLAVVDEPGNGVKIVVGNGPTNGWLGWFASLSSQEDVFELVYRPARYVGFPVLSNSRILRISNPTGDSVDYQVFLLGE